jgi:hypothetical protein
MFNKLKKLLSPKKADNEFICSCCGKAHHEWPALVYSRPAYYDDLTEEGKNNFAELTSDYCVIKHEGQTDRFIRVTLTIPVNNSDQGLHYGLWVSLSEDSFYDYIEKFDEEEREGGYFGWISNNIIGYSDSLSIPTDVWLKPNGLRPEIVPHLDYDHPLVHDYYNGISRAVAEERIHKVLNSKRQPPAN